LSPITPSLLGLLLPSSGAIDWRKRASKSISTAAVHVVAL